MTAAAVKLKIAAWYNGHRLVARTEPLTRILDFIVRQQSCRQRSKPITLLTVSSQHVQVFLVHLRDVKQR